MVPTDSDRGLDHEESPKSGFGAGIDQSLVKHGKPCIPSLISAVISETSADHRVLVMGCGPITLMDEVRRTTAANIRAEGPVVELHCEQFGW